MKKDLIKTNDYLLVVDDSEIKESEYFYLNDAVIIAKYVDAKPVAEALKIIAHQPLNDCQTLEGVPLLPPMDSEVFANPSNFEFEMEEKFADGYTEDRVRRFYCSEIKTLTNSQGQIVACGKYIYES